MNPRGSNQRSSQPLLELFQTSPSPGRLNSETEYDRDKKPRDINLADIPSCNRRSRTTSDSDDVQIVGDDEVTSTVGTSSTTQTERKKINVHSSSSFSSSSLPSLPSLRPSSSSFMGPTSTTTCSSTHRSLSPTGDIKIFKQTGKGYLSATNKHSNEVKVIQEDQRKKIRNVFKKKTSSRRFESDDEDFIPPTSERLKKRTNISTSPTANTLSFYGTGPIPNEYTRYPLRSGRTVSKPQLITSRTRKLNRSCVGGGGGGPGGSEDNPVCLDENNEEEAQITRKSTKLLRSRPSLSTQEDFNTVTLKGKEVKFGTLKCTAVEVEVNTDDIFISFDAHGSLKKAFLNYGDMLRLKTSVHEDPYLIFVIPTSMCCIRLNNLLISIFKCAPPLRGKDNYVILRLDEGVCDAISTGSFEKNVKKAKSYSSRMSESEIEQCLKKLAERHECYESEDPLEIHVSDPVISEPDTDPLLTSWEPRPYLRTRKKAAVPALVQVPDPGLVPDSSLYPENESILSYKFQDVKALPQFTITGQDMNSLGPECYLNDQIINFFLRYYWDRLDDNTKESVYIFSTFFFSRLVNTSRDNPDLETPERFHNRVQSWTKSVNIFDKTYVLVPVCHRSHWFIAIICNIGQYDPSVEPPKIPKPKPVAKKRKRLTLSGRRKRKSLSKENNVIIDEENNETEDISQEKTPSKENNASIDDEDMEAILQEYKGIENLMEEQGTEVEVEEMKDDSSDPVSIMSVGDEAKEEPSPEDMEVIEEGGRVSGSGLKEAEVSMCSKEGPVVTCVCESSPEDNGTEEDSGSLVSTEDGGLMVVSSSQEDCSITKSGDSQTSQCCLVVLDSMLVKRRAVGTNLKKYLTQEYKIKFTDHSPKDFANLPVICPEVPAQTNGFDCGVFMLTYVENFFKHVQEDQRHPKGEEWIGGCEMARKRVKLKDTIIELSHNGTTPSDP